MVDSRIPSLCALAAALAICGCSVLDQDVVSDASTSFDASFGASACARCAFKSCAGEVTNCKEDSTCTTYLDCIDACEVGGNGAVDQACQGRCWNASPGIGSSTVSALSICIMNGPGASCAACGAGDAGLGAILHQSCPADTTAASGCDECASEKCCNTKLACESDPSCATLFECENNCINGLPDEAGASAEPPDGGGYACDLWCGAPANPGLDTFLKNLACTDLLCTNPAVCPGGTSCMACVEQYCQSQYLDELTTHDGYLFENCAKECTEADAAACNDDCLTTYPSAEGPELELVRCAEAHCPACE